MTSVFAETRLHLERCGRTGGLGLLPACRRSRDHRDSLTNGGFGRDAFFHGPRSAAFRYSRRRGYQRLPLPAGYTASGRGGVSGERERIVAGTREQHGRLYEGCRAPAGAQLLLPARRTPGGRVHGDQSEWDRRASESRGASTAKYNEAYKWTAGGGGRLLPAPVGTQMPIQRESDAPQRPMGHRSSVCLTISTRIGARSSGGVVSRL